MPKPQGGNGNGPLVGDVVRIIVGVCCRIGILLAGWVLEWEWRLTDQPIVLGPKSECWRREELGEEDGEWMNKWAWIPLSFPFLLEAMLFRSGLLF